jgi:outer membrane protein
MRNISTYLSLLALIGVGVLFYFQFSSHKKQERPAISRVSSDSSGHFKMAYFDIDSLQDKYQYFKDVSGDIKKKESEMNSQLNALQNSYQKRARELQQKSATMTQAEGEAAQREFTQMQEKYQQRQMALEQDLKKQQIDMMTSVRNKIEHYLKEFNKEKEYAFIMSYEPGFMLYYRDSAYDITNDVIKGLNEEYKKEKK